jgi:phage protein U
MALGPFQFRALGFGFTERDDDVETPWAEIELANRIDQQHWVGPKSQGETIKGVLFPEEYGGVETLRGLKRAAWAGTPLMLVTFAGDVHGLFVVHAVKSENSLGKADGSARRVSYTITIKRIDQGGP